jgi:predicted transcriptional regulator
MPNQPRPDNPARQVRVEDDLWHAADDAAEAEDTTRAEVIRQALRDLVKRHDTIGYTDRPEDLA